MKGWSRRGSADSPGVRKKRLSYAGVRGAGEGEGAGAWTCARATAWNSQHWLREGAWWFEGVSHGPFTQRRARKFAERTVIAIVYEWNDSLQSHACSRVVTRRDAMRCASRRSDSTSGNVDGATTMIFASATDRGRRVRRRFMWFPQKWRVQHEYQPCRRSALRIIARDREFRVFLTVVGDRQLVSAGRADRVPPPSGQWVVSWEARYPRSFWLFFPLYRLSCCM